MAEGSVFNQIPRPVILDVTLRDGGYLNDWQFSMKSIEIAIKSAIKMGADIVEIGYMDDKPGLALAASCPVKFLETAVQWKGSSLLAAMVRPSVENPGRVLEKRKKYIDLARIPVDLRNTEPANKLSHNCLKNNIPFTFNLTSVSCYSMNNIEKAARSLNSDAMAIYIADSRGALQPNDVINIVKVIKNCRDGPVGYHAHNNLGLALKNTEAALHAGCQLIDGSLSGIGLGGRNLNLKLAVDTAKNYRGDLSDYKTEFDVSEELLGVPPPADEMVVYYLSGEKNIKMEWVQLMIEQLGIEVTSRILMKIPRCDLFHENELRPYIGEKNWEKLKW